MAIELGLPALAKPSRVAHSALVGVRLTKSLARYARGIAAAVLVWHVLAVWMDKPLVVPEPLHVRDAWWALANSGALLEETMFSLRRVAVAYVLAAVVGIPTGFAMGRWSIVDRALSPLVNSVRSVSAIAWIPIAVVWFGVSARLPVFIIWYGALFPFVLHAQAGLRAVDARLVLAAKTLGASGRRIATHVILPSSLPYLLNGARIALGLAWMSVIAAELLGSPNGLGYSIQFARLLQQTPAMLAWILWIGVIGLALDASMRSVVRVTTPWSSLGEKH